jgi:putative ABC transport system permease protein
MRMLRDILLLAYKDYGHEWRMSSCFVLGLAAVLAPLMLLFGLKFGIVTGMLRELVDDPHNREIRPIGSGSYDPAWFDAMRARVDVAFVVPKTRSLATVIDLKGEGSGPILATDLITTAAGDPLLRSARKYPAALAEVVLTEGAVHKLGADTGALLDGSVARQFHGVNERAHVKLAVVDVLRGPRFAGTAVYAHVDLLDALESYKDGQAVSALGWAGNAPAAKARNYPAYRLYARSIYDVAKLAANLSGPGREVKTNSAEIETVQSIDRNLSLVFWIIAAAGLLGFALSLGASLLANVDRKRRDLSVLRLVGFSGGGIVLFPMFQALFTAVLGWVSAVLIYLIVERILNRVLARQLEANQSICFLLPRHFLIALVLTLAAALLAALLGGFRAARIEPSEGLRE